MLYVSLYADVAVHGRTVQERSTDLKAEVRALLLKHGVKHMRMVPKNRDYAFEHPDVPHGKQWVLKVRQAAHRPPRHSTQELRARCSLTRNSC